MSSRCCIAVAVLSVAGFMSAVTGCGSASSASTGDARAARGVLKVLGEEYGRFVAEHNGQPPVDKDELVAFLESRKDRIVGLNDVAQLFVSPRDDQPLVVFYGESVPPAGESGFPLIARETTGAGGQCLVANTRGGVEEMALDELPPHLGATK